MPDQRATDDNRQTLEKVLGEIEDLRRTNRALLNEVRALGRRLDRAVKRGDAEYMA